MGGQKTCGKANCKDSQGNPRFLMKCFQERRKDNKRGIGENRNRYNVARDSHGKDACFCPTIRIVSRAIRLVPFAASRKFPTMMPKMMTIPMLLTVPEKPPVMALIVAGPLIPERRPMTRAVARRLMKALALTLSARVKGQPSQ